MKIQLKLSLSNITHDTHSQQFFYLRFKRPEQLIKTNFPSTQERAEGETEQQLFAVAL